ncbi:hypothetical protein SBA6_470010 [Candidatus Sulfopaludibacter sp. SbA6]|nr:hypothetical protein SBA6_470010 [Candidatus Sulfopaludibacter sp. SbA6]
MLIRYSDGRIRVGILMALTGSSLRVALKDEDDVAEYRLLSGQWISEDCEPVTFEFPLAAFQAAGIIPESQVPVLPVAPKNTLLDPAAQHLN